MLKDKRLPDAEFDVMQTIWDQEPPVTTAMLMILLGNERGWKVQTMVTLLARLADRGFIRAEKGAGRERLFYPAISRNEYLRMETESFVDHYHKKSISSLIASLAGVSLTEEDLDELSAFISRTRKENEGK